MSKFLGALGCTSMVVWVSALVVTAANGWWPALSAELAATSLALGGWALYRKHANERRWRAVRALLVEAYDSNGQVVSLDTVASLIGGEEVREAQVAARVRCAQGLASRYANGEASDH
jgi:hypothetical protein